MESPFKVNGISVPYCVEFSEGVFSIKIDGQAPLPLSSGLNLSDEFNPQHFQTYFFHSPGVGEGESKIVYHRLTDKRIGWIIPVSALDSNLHGHKENIHFLKYAYVAIKACLEARWEDVRYNNVDVGLSQSLLLSDVFPEFTAVLVVSSKTLTDGAEFAVDRAVPSMMVNGYIPAGKEFSDPYGWDFDRAAKVYVDMMSPMPNEFLVINNLLRAFARAKNEPVLQFFFLYQIVELLIERVLQCEYSSIASKIISAGHDSSRLKLAIDGVGKSVSESERLKLLNSKYVNSPVDTDRLHILCLGFLDLIGRTVEAGYKRPNPGLHGSLYQVRNAIFHGFRDVPVQAVDALKDVVKELLVVISQMLARYQLPQVPSSVGNALCIEGQA